MKKYKKNITIKIACMSTEFLISFIPMVVIVILFVNPNRLIELPKFIILTILTIVCLNLFLYIISLIGKLFIKTVYIIDNDKLIVRSNSYCKVINLKSVNAITYDLGGVSYNGNNPSKISII